MPQALATPAGHLLHLTVIHSLSFSVWLCALGECCGILPCTPERWPLLPDTIAFHWSYPERGPKGIIKKGETQGLNPPVIISHPAGLQFPWWPVIHRPQTSQLFQEVGCQSPFCKLIWHWFPCPLRGLPQLCSVHTFLYSLGHLRMLILMEMRDWQALAFGELKHLLLYVAQIHI